METENRYIETDLGNVAPNPRGNYSTEATYEYLDLVVYQGGSYLCITDTSKGVAPESGKTTAVWQVLALPGDLTPEYVAIHDDVVNKAASAAEDAASTAADRAAVADMKEDVEQLQREVTESTASAKADKESAAGYAAAAEASRKAATEAEANVTAQVNGFDEHVASKTLDATEAIASAREKAVQVVDSATRAAKSAASSAAGSASTATQAASTATSQATAALAASKTATSAASETVKTAKAAQEDIATAKSNAIKAVQDAAVEEKKAAAASAENAATSAESAKTSADNAVQSAKSVEDASKQIEQNKKDVASLKEDISNKITKFYASNQGETHLADPDNGKIQDMVLYGKSEQNQYKGINLLPTGISYTEIIEVSIPKGAHIFWATDGTPAIGGNFRFYNEDKTQETWFGVDAGKTAMTSTIDMDVKYIEFLISKAQSVKICLGIGDDPVYEPYTGGQPSPSPDYPQEIKSVVNPTVKVSSEDETESQTVTLPYTLNAIPVSSGGNVTIDGHQYVADYVDVGKKKRVGYILSRQISPDEIREEMLGKNACYILDNMITKPSTDAEIGHIMCSHLMQESWNNTINKGIQGISLNSKANYIGITITSCKTVAEYKDFFKNNNVTIMYQINPIYSDLLEKNSELSTYYPVTNISINSEQLDGYTVFNYPISMKNGWDYIKKQLNDNRDYIYDMDTQSAEAYVNSEYAVALTELEV